MSRSLAILGLSFLILFSGSVAFGEHMFEGKMTFSQYLDIAKLVGEQYTVNVDENSFTIYYGYGGSMEVDIEELQQEVRPTVSSMNINTEKKSLEVHFNETPQKIVMWLRLPLDLISAEGENYQLLIDGVETEYDLTKYPDDYAIGMILPQGTQKIEIIGTYVIPEFGTVTSAIFAISLLSMIVLFQKKSKFLPL